jgi:hypothetical protein
MKRKLLYLCLTVVLSLSCTISTVNKVAPYSHFAVQVSTYRRAHDVVETMRIQPAHSGFMEIGEPVVREDVTK